MTKHAERKDMAVFSPRDSGSRAAIRRDEQSSSFTAKSAVCNSRRANNSIRRSRSAVDLEIFQHHVRLNKSLSRRRLKQEFEDDLAQHPPKGSVRADPEGSELHTRDDSPRQVKKGGKYVSSTDHLQAEYSQELNSDPANEKELEKDYPTRTLDSNGENEHDALRASPSLAVNPNSSEKPEAAEESKAALVPEDDAKWVRRRPMDIVLTPGRLKKERQDGAIVIYPMRNKSDNNWQSSEGLMPDNSSVSSSLSSGEEEDMWEGVGPTQFYKGPKRRDRAKAAWRKAVQKQKDHWRTLLTFRDSESDLYDTDLEVEENSEFKAAEINHSKLCVDADFGHMTYQAACTKFKVVPRQRIVQQLLGSCLSVNFCGLDYGEARALAMALRVNNRLQEVDLASNGMTGPSIACIVNCFPQNIYVTKLNLSGNTIEEEGARSLGLMMKSNKWITHLCLSDCRVNDQQVAFLARGLQENSTLVYLDLSKNKLENQAGRQLATALGRNHSLECLNLNWNMLRGGGTVALCNSLQKNKTLKEVELAWNGLGYQGSLAISEVLRLNRFLVRLNIASNRLDWDCTPHLARALSVNNKLQVLQMGCNPVSLEGCMKLLEAINRPRSNVRFLSLAGIPICSQIALKATEISKKREFRLEHGYVISTGDVFRNQKVKKDDPLSLLIRYLSAKGIRLIDLFRMFDTTSNLYVSQANFIRGLKEIGAPLEEREMYLVARKLRSAKNGDISYQEMLANVRKHIREEYREDKRLQWLDAKRQEEQRRILQNDCMLNTCASSFFKHPALFDTYNTQPSTRLSQEGLPSATPRFTPVDSIATKDRSEAKSGSPRRRSRKTSAVFLPRLDMSRDTVESRFSLDLGLKSPMTLVSDGTKGLGRNRKRAVIKDIQEARHSSQLPNLAKLRAAPTPWECHPRSKLQQDVAEVTPVKGMLPDLVDMQTVCRNNAQLQPPRHTVSRNQSRDPRERRLREYFRDTRRP